MILGNFGIFLIWGVLCIFLRFADFGLFGCGLDSFILLFWVLEFERSVLWILVLDWYKTEFSQFWVSRLILFWV